MVLGYFCITQLFKYNIARGRTKEIVEFYLYKVDFFCQIRYNKLAYILLCFYERFYHRLKLKEGKSQMIRNIVFDIGQVLAAFRWKEFINELGYEEQINNRIAKATVLSPYWNEVDRGEKSMAEIIELCISLDPQIEQEIRSFFSDRRNMVVEFDYSEELVRTLKEQGYQVFLLSNYGEENFMYVKNVFKFISLVDGGIISYQIKKIKPEPEIYQALIDKYNINPEESVFLDDLEKNIEGAKAFGFQTILFQNLKQAKEDLRKKGIEIT